MQRTENRRPAVKKARKIFAAITLFHCVEPIKMQVSIIFVRI